LVFTAIEKIFKMKFIKIHINLVYDIVFSILVFSLPLSMALPNICLAILSILFIFKNDKINFKSYVFKATLVLISFFILKAIITHTFFINGFFYKKLLIVLALTLFTQKIENKKLIKASFILGVFLAIIITLYNIINYYFKFNEIPLGDTNQSIKLLLVYRPYFGFLCVLVVIFLLQLRAETLIKIVYLNIGIFIISCFIVLISARLSLILLIVIFITQLLKNKQITLKRTALYIALAFTIFGALIYSNKNLKQSFHMQNNPKETLNELSNYEPRVIIWDCAFNMIKQDKYNFWCGFNNIQTIKDNLLTCYAEKIENKSKKDFYISEKFNTHNQFIDFLLSGGLLGFLIFSSFFVYIMYNTKGNVYAQLLIVSFIMFCLLENVLWRQMGAYLFGIVLPLCELDNLKNHAKQR